MHSRSPPSAPVRCRGALLPALYFEPVVLPAAAARAAVAGLVSSPDDLVLMVFPDGDVGDDAALVQVGTASNAWPNGARSRSLPLLPALRLTGVRGRSHDELRTTADAVLGARQLRRRLFYDTLVIAADGATTAVFWTFEAPDPARRSGGPLTVGVARGSGTHGVDVLIHPPARRRRGSAASSSGRARRVRG